MVDSEAVLLRLVSAQHRLSSYSQVLQQSLDLLLFLLLLTEVKQSEFQFFPIVRHVDDAGDLKEEEEALVRGGELETGGEVHGPDVNVFGCLLEQVGFIQILEMSAEHNILV